MTTATHTLLTKVLDAHGGIDRWHQFSKVRSIVVSGGFLWGMKGIPLDDTPRAIISEFRRQWTRVEPFGQADWHMLYEPTRVVIETQAGEVVAQQDNPRETFAGHAWETRGRHCNWRTSTGTRCGPTTTFRFSSENQASRRLEIPSIADGGSVLRGLRVRFPQEIHSHSSEQSLYFDDIGLLRRQDYEVDVAGRGRAAHLISDYVDVQGLLFPTRRRVFMRNADGTLQFDKMPVSIDLSDFELS